MADVRPLTHREMVEWLDRWKDVVPVVADDALLEALRDLVGEAEGYVDNCEGKPWCDVAMIDHCFQCYEGNGPNIGLCALHRAKELLKRLDTGAGK